MKKFLFAVLGSLCLAMNAMAGTTLYLPQVPHTVPLDPIVSVPGPLGACYAASSTTVAYRTVVTGFSADGNYIIGQVDARYPCGHSGRGSTVHYLYACTAVTWDLSGNLISAVATPAFTDTGLPANNQCPAVDASVVYTNAGGYEAGTQLVQACGSVACYATYFYPYLITP